MLTNSPRSIRGTARSTAYWNAMASPVTAATGRRRPAGPAGTRRRPPGRTPHPAGACGSGRVGSGSSQASGTSARIVASTSAVTSAASSVMHRPRVADDRPARGRRSGTGRRRSRPARPRRGGSAGRRRGRSPTGCGARSAGWCCAHCGRRWRRTRPARRSGPRPRRGTVEAAVVADRSRQEVDRQVQPGAGADAAPGPPGPARGGRSRDRPRSAPAPGPRCPSRRPSSPTTISATSAFGP